MAADILIVDDEDDIRELVAGILEDEGHGTRARRAIPTRRWPRSRRDGRNSSCSTSGCRARNSTGCNCSRRSSSQHPNVPVVMISGHGNIETAVSAIKLGAYDFIEKPFKADRLILIAERALETSRLKREVSDLRARGGADNRMVGSSAAISNLRRVIEQAGPRQFAHPHFRRGGLRQGTGRAAHPSNVRRAPTGRSSSSTRRR